MAEISLTLLCGAEDRITVRLDLGDGPTSAEVAGPAHELIADLTGQLRSARMAGAAARHLSEVLGRIVFAGTPGEALRAALRDDPEPIILLAADARVAEWPWELARDPETSAPLALEGATLVRESGAPAERCTANRRAVLVVPGDAAQGHVGTLQAATRPLGRKLGVDVFPVEPVTGPALRRSLARGALFVHIEAPLQGEALVLEDGHVPVERIGVDGETWLVVLGGPEVTMPVHGRLRALGVPLVLGLQIALEPAAAAALDRELYRALAAGEPVGEALRRARRALVRFGGLDGHAWAAPVLWAAPSVRGVGSPAALPFPPPASQEERREAGATLMDLQVLRLGGANASGPPLPAPTALPDLLRSPAPAAGRPRPVLPQPAPVFIQETIRCIREARQDPELPARVETLRALGGASAIDAQDAELAELSPSERTTRLADRLVAAISRTDAPLGEPPALSERLEAAARGLGLRRANLELMAQALLAGRGLVLQGGDAALRRVIFRSLAGEIFDRALLTARSDLPERLIGGPVEHGFGGFGYESLALNWRRDEVDPFRLDAAGPSHRVPVVGRAPSGAFRVLDGVWLLVEVTTVDPSVELRELLRAVDEGGLVGVAGGRMYQMRVPADFRLLVSTTAAAPLRPWLPPEVGVVTLDGSAFGFAERPDEARDRWLALAEAAAPGAADVGETHARRAMAALAVEVAGALAGQGVEVAAARMVAALTLALHLTGTPEARLDAALALHVGPVEGPGAAALLRFHLPRLLGKPQS